jgi:DNA-binding response OmpR family regulator
MSARVPEVLIVEHEAAVAELLAEAARDGGMAARLLRSAGEALEATRGPVPDVVLLDLELPQSFGTNLGSALRASWPAARFLLLTDLSEEAAGKAKWTLKAESVIAKPVSAEAIHDALLQQSVAA